jgi:UDP-glucose 4-epimerase
MTQVLVTGGAGFVGSRLAAALLEDGYDVHIVDDLSTGDSRNVPPAAQLFERDLTRPDALDGLDGAYAAILHLAGQASGEKSFDDPLRDFDANARSTMLLARWALARGIPSLIHASSMGVYGEAGETPLPESSPTRPLSWYGSSKLAAEQALAVAGRLGLRTCSLRMFSVYGPGQNLADLRQGMVSIYLAYLLRSEPVIVRGSLDRVRDFVFVDDVVDAWKRALESGVQGAFNIGTGVGTRVRELVAALAHACDLPSDYPHEIVEGTPGDQFAAVADNSRAREQLGWVPHVSLENGLDALVAWARMGGAKHA